MSVSIAVLKDHEGCKVGADLYPVRDMKPIRGDARPLRINGVQGT